MQYTELHCKTNFSFLEGASHADELVARASELGYQALAVTDRNSLAGVVRAHTAAKDAALKLIIGAEITPTDALPVVVWVTDRQAYARLSRLITRGRRRAEKGECELRFEDIVEFQEGLVAGVVPRGHEHLACGEDDKLEACRHGLQQYRELFGDRCYLLAELHRGPDDRGRLSQLKELSKQTRIPLVAAGDVHYHVAARMALHDLVTAIRYGTTVAEIGEQRFPNAQHHLRTLDDIKTLFADAPDALHRTMEISDRCSFLLDELRYEYPVELAPSGMTSLEYLTTMTWKGAKKRYPRGVPEKVRQLIEHELKLIGELHYEAYFLHGVRSGSLCPRERHSLSGTRLGGEFGRLFLLGSYLGRSCADGCVVRAVCQSRAE